MEGTLLITGVSPRPDAAGEQYVTITGAISGSTVKEHIVCERLVVNVQHWPTEGELVAVTYSPKNPDFWWFALPWDPDIADTGHTMIRYWWCRLRRHHVTRQRSLPRLTAACHNCGWRKVSENTVCPF